MSGTATTTDLHIRINAELKNEAEAVFEDLGVSPASAVSIFYKQVVMRGGLPFEVVKHYQNAPDMSQMSDEELERELEKGMDDVRAGRVYTLEETLAAMEP